MTTHVRVQMESNMQNPTDKTNKRRRSQSDGGDGGERDILQARVREDTMSLLLEKNRQLVRTGRMQMDFDLPILGNLA
jgi:hypothetical protein